MQADEAQRMGGNRSEGAQRQSKQKIWPTRKKCCWNEERGSHFTDCYRPSITVREHSSAVGRVCRNVGIYIDLSNLLKEMSVVLYYLHTHTHTPSN